MSKENEPPRKFDSNPRELIGVVCLSNGENIEVRMPITKDIVEAGMKGKNPFHAVIEAATKMSYEEFCLLPMTDGAAIMDKLNIAFEAMKKYTGSGNLN